MGYSIVMAWWGLRKYGWQVHRGTLGCRDGRPLFSIIVIEANKTIDPTSLYRDPLLHPPNTHMAMCCSLHQCVIFNKVYLTLPALETMIHVHTHVKSHCLDAISVTIVKWVANCEYLKYGTQMRAGTS